MPTFKRWTIALVIACAVVLAGAGIWTASSHSGPSEASPVTGTVEGTEVDLNSKIPGRIVKLLVSEGDQVKAGQVIAKISDDELKAKETQALALVQAAKDTLSQAEQGAALQEKISLSNITKASGAMNAAQAQLDKAHKGARSQEIIQAQANFDLWNKTYARVQRLYNQGAVPAQKLDEVKTQLEVARQTLSLANEGARQEDIRSAQGLVDQARAGVEAANAGMLQIKMAKDQVQAAKAKYNQALGGLQEVQAYLKDTEVRAPIDGTITMLAVDPGELISSGMPIATVTDTQNLWVEVKVKETELPKISLGQKAKVTLASNPGQSLPGTVVRIAKKPDFAAKRATNDRGEQDIFAYGVKIKFSCPKNLPAVGVSATVSFNRSTGE